MSSRSLRASTPSSSSKKHSSSSRSNPKSDDWSEVTDPEERRRIQNRIAQRKFRGKARELKEKNERDQRNLEHAGSSYRVPQPGDMAVEGGDLAGLSGLPWGGVNIRYVVDRAYESAASQGSHRASDYNNPTVSHGRIPSAGEVQCHPGAYDPLGYQYTADGSSGGEEHYYGGSPVYYDYDASEGSHGH